MTTKQVEVNKIKERYCDNFAIFCKEIGSCVNNGVDVNVYLDIVINVMIEQLKLMRNEIKEVINR